MIACEKFIISGGTVTKGRGEENWSIEQIGIMRHWARRFGHIFEPQAAGDMKKFSLPKLKQVGWHTPGKTHANDAAGHVLLCLARLEVFTFEQLLTRN